MEESKALFDLDPDVDDKEICRLTEVGLDFPFRIIQVEE